jgi:hypothetical protein
MFRLNLAILGFWRPHFGSHFGFISWSMPAVDGGADRDAAASERANSRRRDRRFRPSRAQWSTKTSMGGYTPPLVRWRIIHYYSVENITQWTALAKRLHAGLYDLRRNRHTCKRIVQLWLFKSIEIRSIEIQIQINSFG